MAKFNREQFIRGANEALDGDAKYYGCHFGMRSTLEHDRASYNAGHDAGTAWLAGRGEYRACSFDEMLEIALAKDI